MTKSDELYTNVTAKIVAALEAGASGEQWSAPWHSTAGTLGFPTNVATHKAYRGVNVLILWSAQLELGYESPTWGTYNQWKAAGAQVRKGEKATTGMKWTAVGKREATDTKEEKGSYAFASSFSVFNAAQVDGFEIPTQVEVDPFEAIEHAQAFFTALGADVRHGGNRAYYTPAADAIQLPNPESFVSAVDYYSTSAHEHTHWTSHKSRCDRDLGTRFGNDAYAAEELIAELGAAYVCAFLGISNEPREDHAQYLASWISVLKNDPKAIVTAASKAQAACDWLQKAAGVNVDNEQEAAA